MKAFFKACKEGDVPVSWFNIGMHEDSLEIYTAEEHGTWKYTGGMGVDTTDDGSVEGFIKNVKDQHAYYKSKEGKQ